MGTLGKTKKQVPKIDKLALGMGLVAFLVAPFAVYPMVKVSSLVAGVLFLWLSTQGGFSENSLTFIITLLIWVSPDISGDENFSLFGWTLVLLLWVVLVPLMRYVGRRRTGTWRDAWMRR